MGETASSWNVPLHSSDSEHEWMKRNDSKGFGAAFKIKRGEQGFPPQKGDPLAGLTPSTSSADSNPYDTDAD